MPLINKNVINKNVIEKIRNFISITFNVSINTIPDEREFIHNFNLPRESLIIYIFDMNKNLCYFEIEEVDLNRIRINFLELGNYVVKIVGV